MTRFTLKGLAARKLRAALTAIAIVLGVAMVSGTFVLTDTMQRAFDSIMSSSYEETDAVVSGRKIVDWSQTGKANVPEGLLAEIRALPEVETAAGAMFDLGGDSDVATIVDKQGKPIPAQPSFGFGIDPDQPRFNPFELVSGRWAQRGEVVLDAGTAANYGFRIGDLVRVSSDGAALAYPLVGIATFGEVESLGTAAMAVFDVPTAQTLHRKTGFGSILVAAKDGVSAERLVSRLERIAPRTAQVRTGAEQAEEDAAGVDEFIQILRWGLLGFAGISLFVGAFVIFNTLSITVAQRTRELATVRTLGGSRRQVLRSVVLEALVLGIFASLVGIALGVGLAKGIDALFTAVGVDMPNAQTVFALRTVAVSLVLGTGITLLASLVPAIRATRVPAISAVREGAAVPCGRLSRRTTAVAAATVSAASGALVYGTLGSGIEPGVRATALGFGILGLFVGMAMLAPRLVRPLAAVLGAPSARLGGVSGRLARQNALRNPTRTAATAAALMIGLTLVTFVAVLGRALLVSDEKAVRDQVASSYVINSLDGWNTVPVGAGQAAADATGVERASSVRGDYALLGGSDVMVSGVDPATIARAYRFDWKSGSNATVASLDRSGAIVSSGLAKDEGLAVGESVSFRTPTGRDVSLAIRGVYDDSRFETPLLGQVLISQERFDASFPRPGDAYTFVDASSPAGLERALAAFPSADLQTLDEFVESRASDLSNTLSMLYVLLGLSVVVSLFGMINTLVLAVFERTRELGMLRAVGMTRRQVRRMIRHEAILTSLIGAGIGLPLGIGLAALAIRAMSDYGIAFALPTGTLVTFTVVAIVAGLLAALLPARRASRLNVLNALQYE
jgi:putative ABC transport system permease protein